jgi:hypothetical protein
MFKALRQLFGLDIFDRVFKNVIDPVTGALIAAGIGAGGDLLSSLFGGGGDEYEDPRFYPIPEWAYPKLLREEVAPPELAVQRLPMWAWQEPLLEQGAGIVGGLGESIYGRGEMPWYLQELSDVARTRGTEALEKAYYGTPEQAGILAQYQAGPASRRLGAGGQAQGAYQAGLRQMGQGVSDLERAIQTSALQETSQLAKAVPDWLRGYGTTQPPDVYKWYDPFQYQWFTPAIGGFPQAGGGGGDTSMFSSIGQALPWLLAAGGGGATATASGQGISQMNRNPNWLNFQGGFGQQALDIFG